MMARKPKTPKFEGFAQLDNCFDFYKQENFHGYLDTSGPLSVELGCGKAELLLELTRRHPDKGYIGVDIKSDRMYKPAQTAEQEKLANVAFVRAHAKHTGEIFGQEEIDALWLTFPDPYPKKRSAKHRLLHPFFLALYEQVLTSGGVLHFKTDNDELFRWSLEQLRDSVLKIETISQDVHGDEDLEDEVKIMTDYERRFIGQGLSVKYCRAIKP